MQLFDNRVSQTSQSREDNRLVDLCLYLIAIASFGNFSDQLVLGNTTVGSFLPQQFASLFGWVIMALLINVRSPMLFRVDGSLSILLFYAYAAISALWGPDPLPGLAKGGLLLFVTGVVFQLTLTIEYQRFLNIVRLALITLVVVSMLLAIAVPAIGVLDTWQHAGQWNGIFKTKQDLGFASAFLIALTLFQKRPEVGVTTTAVLAAASTCLYMSGSRGATALVALAIVLYFISFKSYRIFALLTWAPFVFCLVALANIAYLTHSRWPIYLIGAEEYDLTGRTYIWHYALSEATSTLIFGTGLNQFWNAAVNEDQFTRMYGWFLDNFHSGYIGVFVELGLFGYALFCIISLACGRRLYRLASGSQTAAASAHRNSLYAVLVVLIYSLNFTETYFLRSTSFYQVLLSYIIFDIFRSSREIDRGTYQNE